MLGRDAQKQLQRLLEEKVREISATGTNGAKASRLSARRHIPCATAYISGNSAMSSIWRSTNSYCSSWRTPHANKRSQSALARHGISRSYPVVNAKTANVRLGLLLALYPRVVFVARLTSRRQSLAIVTRCVVRRLRWASRQGHMIAGFMQQLLESERLLSEGVMLTMKDPKGCDWGHPAVALALWEFTVEQNRALSTVSSLPRAL